MHWCSKAILKIIKEVINPEFKAHELPEITVRIGMTYGYVLVVLYGNNLERAHIDILGSSIKLGFKNCFYCEAESDFGWRIHLQYSSVIRI